MPAPKTRKRLPAGEVCRARGWGPGTVVHSPGWSGPPRTVVAVEPTGVFLRDPAQRGREGQFFRTFPRDIEEVASG
ncbi:MAG: hypothetical protein GWN84_20705 [Gammaproteobacteria bacterium]|nr:hypothetical protein [Gammaproteobacteria bacterium]NIR85182.1 hypothetical protein [Gammaproteobacteria bacterium]NIU06231.1 hypothetical protein [Gammaproteobacteria bacterium]NIX87504.1 hypothetical protein [Gammaproteobacteria bacterium]